MAETKAKIEKMLEKIGIQALTAHVPIVLEYKQFFNHSVPKQEDTLEFMGNTMTKSGPVSLYERRKRDKFFLHPQRAVCKKWAALFFNERTDLQVQGKPTDAKLGAQELNFLKELYTAKNLYQILEQETIKTFGIGTVAIAPEYSAEYGIVFSSYDAENIFPITIDNGRITEVALAAQKIVGGKTYTILNVHLKKTANNIKADGNSPPLVLSKDIRYLVQNFVFDEENEPVGPEVIGLSQEAAAYDMPCRMFAILIPFNRAVDELAPVQNTIGAPIYIDALDTIKDIDSDFDAKYIDKLLSRKWIIVPEHLLPKDKERALVPSFAKQAIIVGNAAEDLTSNKSSPIEFSPTPRMDMFSQEIQHGLNRLSLACGLGSEEFKFERGGITTATQIVSQNQEKFVNLKKHNSIMQGEFININRAILAIANDKEGKTFDLTLNIGFFIQDSVLVDDDTRRHDMREECRLGLRSTQSYLQDGRGLQGKEYEEELAALNSAKEAETNSFISASFGNRNQEGGADKPPQEGGAPAAE